MLERPTVFAVGSIDVNAVVHKLPTGQTLLDGVSFKINDGDHAALVGANGVGKTTLFRQIASGSQPESGAISIHGSLVFMNQMIGMREGQTVRDLYLELSPEPFREAAALLARSEARLAEETDADEAAAAGVAYANALGRWGDIGGYDLEVLWAECADRAVGLDWSELADRATTTFSGGEQKRLALELLFRSEFDVLLLDEPDNFLDVPGKEWLTEQINGSKKTIFFISHDRELLAQASNKVVTLEAHGAWTHGESFATWSEARAARVERLDDEHRRWAEERKRLFNLMKTAKIRAAQSDANASRGRAAETRLRHFDESGPPPERAVEQNISMKLGGGRTGKIVLTAEDLELTDLTFPFSTEIWFGERVAVVGMNGTGKSHFLRLLDGGEVKHDGVWKLGARVVPGLFSQTHEHPELVGKQLLDVLFDQHSVARTRAMGLLRRYELSSQHDQTWETLSGGQQARFQILLLELSGSTLLLLDEPTDNLDVASAEALEAALATFEGTVISVSHDRWFLRSFDRFLVFDTDAEVYESDTPEAAWTLTP